MSNKIFLGTYVNTNNEESTTLNHTAENRPMKSILIDIQGHQESGTPYPTGAGVNKLDPSQVTAYETSTDGFSSTWDASSETLTVTGTYTGETSTATIRVLNVPNSYTSYNVKGFSTAPACFSSAVWQSGEDVISASFVALVTGTTYTFKIQIVLYTGSTAPSTWTSYSGVKPITGYDKLNLTCIGKNLFNINNCYPSYISSDGTKLVLPSSNNRNVHAATTGTNPTIPSSYFDKLIKLNKGTYTLTLTANSNTVIYVYKVDKTTGKTTSLTTSSTSTSIKVTFTITEDDTWITLNSSSGSRTLSYIMIEKGSVATTYVPYISNIVEYDLPYSIYNGAIDLANGVLEYDYIAYQIPMDAKITAVTISSIVAYYFTVPLNHPAYTNAQVADVHSEKYVASYYKNKPQYSISARDGYPYGFYVYDPSIVDLEDAQSKLRGMKIYYKLDSKRTLSFTPLQVRSIIERTYLHSNTGNILRVTYPIDGVLYAKDKLIPEYAS